MKDSITSFDQLPEGISESLVDALNRIGLVAQNLSYVISTGNVVDVVQNNISVNSDGDDQKPLDVFADEPAKNNILFGLENVLLTPHIAASTAEAQVIVAEMIANQFVDFFLKNKVNNSVI